MTFRGPADIVSSKRSTCLCVLSYLYVTLSRQGTLCALVWWSTIRAALLRMGEEDTSPGLLQRERKDGRGTYKQTSLKKKKGNSLFLFKNRWPHTYKLDFIAHCLQGACETWSSSYNRSANTCVFFSVGYVKLIKCCLRLNIWENKWIVTVG